MRQRFILSLGGVSLLLLLLLASTAVGASFSIGAYSQRSSNEHAQAGGSITVTSSRPGREGSVAPAPTGGGSEGGVTEPGASATSEPAQGETGCVARGEANVSPCFGVVPAPAAPAPPAPGPARPPVNPAAMAVSAAAGLDLSVGGIVASPSAQTAGLTGAASWFWLEPAPTSRSVSVSLRGEQVTVSANAASVRWSFGDESSLVAGPGVPYRPGRPLAGAVRHIYKTRCLPGDRGHDPNVLSSCGPNGYTVTASVVWAISYQATGPVTTSGALPARATSASTAYPVSEARAFLTPGGSGE